MTVTLYSWTPPTSHASRYLLRPTLLNGPRTTPLDRRSPLTKKQIDQIMERVKGDDALLKEAEHWYAQGLSAEQTCERLIAKTLDDIDDWYSPQIEDDGFLERLDRSAEIVRFP